MQHVHYALLYDGTIPLTGTLIFANKSDYKEFSEGVIRRILALTRVEIHHLFDDVYAVQDDELMYGYVVIHDAKKKGGENGLLIKGQQTK